MMTAEDVDISEAPQLGSRCVSIGSRRGQIPEFLIAIQITKEAGDRRPVHQRKGVWDLQNPSERPHKVFSTPLKEVVGVASSSTRRAANSQPVNASRYHINWQTKVNK